ncbi:hypothetical protein F5887DRAFT_1071293 [Amanita rubescens]|nr:hypothetical protein F5887DRAFT_1071293 [Amanita rubescens]
MEKHGFKVERKLHLETAWRATFFHRSGGRTIGLNSEVMCCFALALKAALVEFKISGKVSLLGTPAEEGGAGKAILLDKGAYMDMDICLMTKRISQPLQQPLQRIEVEYSGHTYDSCYAYWPWLIYPCLYTAHAALSPWEGKNNLDAAVLAYNNISALRQQLHPAHRVHGIIEGKDWAANIIPVTRLFLDVLLCTGAYESANVTNREASHPLLRVRLQSAAATGCELKLNLNLTANVVMCDLRQNKALGGEVADITLNKYGDIDYLWGIKDASTDFGNVTYALPSLHPGFAIPTVPNGENHWRSQMITHGEEKIISSSEASIVEDDIEAIIPRGEDRMQQLMSKYEGRTSAISSRIGEDFRTGRKVLGLGLLSLSKHEPKSYYSVDGYFKDTFRTLLAGKSPQLPRAPKQIAVKVHILQACLLRLCTRSNARWDVESLSSHGPLRKKHLLKHGHIYLVTTPPDI